MTQIQPRTTAAIQAEIDQTKARLADLLVELIGAQIAEENHPAATAEPIDPKFWERGVELGMDPVLAERLDAYLAALDKLAVMHFQIHNYRWDSPKHIVEPNPAGKFLRVVAVEQGRGNHVHAFIEKATGKVVKAAGWKAPAKSTAAATKGELLSKYTLGDEQSFKELLGVLSVDSGQIHGGYLYGATASA